MGIEGGGTGQVTAPRHHCTVAESAAGHIAEGVVPVIDRVVGDGLELLRIDLPVGQYAVHVKNHQPYARQNAL